MATENKQSRGLAPKMGFWNSFLTWLKIKKKEANILIVGLDNSGKSTIVQYFQSPGAKRTETVPTIGFRVDKIKSKFLQLCPQKIHRLVTFVRTIDDGLTLTAFDMSGQSKYRSLWEVKFCYGFGVYTCFNLVMLALLWRVSRGRVRDWQQRRDADGRSFQRTAADDPASSNEKPCRSHSDSGQQERSGQRRTLSSGKVFRPFR